MTDRLHVTHVVLSLDVGGLERNVLNQAREGPLLGQRVSIVCVERPGTLAAQAETLGAEVVCLHKAPGLRLGTIKSMRAALRRLRPDIVHTHQIGPLFYTGCASRRLPHTLVHTEHGIEEYARRPRLRWLGWLGARFVERFYCLTADMARNAVDNKIVPARKVALIRNGIDVDAFQRPHDVEAVRRQLGIPAAATVIGTVGRLTEIKRQDVLLRAFAEVHRSLPQTHLLLVGDGPLRAELEALAGELGFRDVVHFAGYRPDSAPYLQAMNVFALTSRSEGMPQAVLEASVVGLPVVASRVGGLPEVVEDGQSGLLFPAGDVQALTGCLLEILHHPTRARQLGEAGKQRVEGQFSVRRMAREYQRDFVAFTQPKLLVPKAVHP